MKYPYTLVQHTQDTVIIHLPLYHSMDYFNGHFDQQAILPAVAQLYLVESFSKQLLDINGIFINMRQIKFVGPICPDTFIDIHIEYDRIKNQISYKILEKGVLKSKGKLNYSLESNHE